MDAANQRVEGELPDRDAEAARALIADAQNALAVGHDDDVDVLIRTVSQECVDGVAERIGNEQSARPPVDVAELLTRQRDHGRVDHRRHFRNVVEKKPVKEDLVGVLQGAQVDVPLQVVVFSLVSLISAHDLLVQRLDLRRQKPVQAKLGALRVAERRTFVQQRAIEEIHPARGIGDT